MKVLSILLTVMFISHSANAESLSCVLSSDKVKSELTGDFSNLKNGYLFLDNYSYVYDLSQTLEGNCDNVKCKFYATMASQMAEDEFAQYTFEFVRGEQQTVFEKRIKHSEEGRSYQLSCQYKP